MAEVALTGPKRVHDDEALAVAAVESIELECPGDEARAIEGLVVPDPAGSPLHCVTGH